jgi:ATP-binding cassette, subfamily B, multidrug efflux pump
MIAARGGAGGQGRPGGPVSGPPRGPMGGPPRGPMGHGPGGFGAPVAKPKNFRASARRLLGTLRPEAHLVAIVIVLAVISVTFAIAGPKILGNATNILFEGVIGQRMPPGVTKAQAVAGLRGSGQERLADMLASLDVVPGQGVDFDALGRILLVLLGVYVLSAAFSWAQGYLMAGVTQRTAYRLRRGVEGKLGRLPLSYFDRQSRGDILSRVTNDIDNIAQSLQQSLTQLITGVLTVVGVLFMMFTISPMLAVISILVVPLSVVVTVLIASRSQKQFAAQWDQTGKLNGHIEEMHTGHAVVKVFGRQRDAIAVFDTHNTALYEASFKAQFISGTIQPALNFLGNLNYVAIAVIGGVRVASGQMSLGDVQAFIQYSRQFTMPIVQTASIMNVLQSAVASAERVFELLDEREEVPDALAPQTLAAVHGRVALENVSFRYEPDTPLLEDLDLVVEPGRTVAIVGPTGAGKTTLVNLLMRFYELDSGRITVDGVDIRALSRDNLRRLFGMVLQDAWLFNGTIRENIAYGADTATDDQVMAAARAAHVDHFVRTLPDGYATVVDDEAANVSQGERQLLTIARAFLVDPPILILDEATSSVDTRTEVLIQRAMATLMKDRTSFVIAHRLSTIRDADTILVMNNGRIIEQGTHEELLARRGFYADLYASQFLEAENGNGTVVPPAVAAATVAAALRPPSHPALPPATPARTIVPVAPTPAAAGHDASRPDPSARARAPLAAAPGAASPRGGIGWPALLATSLVTALLAIGVTLALLAALNDGLRYRSSDDEVAEPTATVSFLGIGGDSARPRTTTGAPPMATEPATGAGGSVPTPTLGAATPERTPTPPVVDGHRKRVKQAAPPDASGPRVTPVATPGPASPDATLPTAAPAGHRKRLTQDS